MITRMGDEQLQGLLRRQRQRAHLRGLRTPMVNALEELVIRRKTCISCEWHHDDNHCGVWIGRIPEAVNSCDAWESKK